MRSSQGILILAMTVALAPPAGGQRSRGDSLLSAGNLAAAESTYYAAARIRPRDPQARRQLGRYLAERGAIRVGAVLLEEARQFGADPATIARDLVPLYRALGDYRALSTLPASPLSPGERAQAVWLVEHPPAIEGVDSATVIYRAPVDASTLGRLVLAIDGRSVEASIDPARRGITIDPRIATARLRRFQARGGGSIPAVADSVRFGTLKLTNVPIRLDSLPPRVDAIVGIDIVQRFASSFDPRAGQAILRPAGSVAPTLPGLHVTMLTSPSEVRVIQAGRVVPISTPSFASLLRTKRWTLDAKRGRIVIE
jgi:tetratricopeptide (TPR) repeat protein